MPELPDLLYIRKYLDREVRGSVITDAIVRRPLVLRITLDRPFAEIVRHHTIDAMDIHGPFLRFALSGDIELLVNLMLAGRLQHQRPGEKAEGYVCCSLVLQDESRLHLCDPDTMAKMYIVRAGDYASVPRYREQGVDILSPAFTPAVFMEIARRNSRRQVRVFINDHTMLSSIGNAYADEVLFEARIHPKTFVGRLDVRALEVLYHAILSVMEEGARKVEEARQPIQVKVRDHMKVRNRKGDPCPRCGATIRREGVRGYDVFFCPACQAATRNHFINWGPPGGGPSGRES